MKYTITLLVILSLTIFSCQKTMNDNKLTTATISNVTDQNLDGTITIQGFVTVKGTNTAPLGITTMNISNKWTWLDKDYQEYGENQRVYIKKDGYYNITINKGDTLVLIPNQYLYKDFTNYTYTNLTQNQILNIEIEQDLPKMKDLEKNNERVYNNLQKHIKNSGNTDKLITVSGIVYSKETKQPLKDIIILTEFSVNTNGIGSFHRTDSIGQFSLRVPQNKKIAVNPLSYTNSIRFSAEKDTVANIILNI
ncbi:hypothetical protein LNQ81_12945 [Myroides sp. M-43]|uniref:hypothetical protein n=1 Tax=Myroides oncorhynchi TaxID=2893756 RepID=UPI001E5BC471|nr:hypothetical protein [Myroides oncorhynchi]MCC9043581.1 hypothetical protein [Myroides oncorhynchi]